MTPRSLFTVIVKIIGLILIFKFIVVLEIFMRISLYLTEIFYNFNPEQIWVPQFILVALLLFFYYLCLKFFFLKSNIIVDKLRLDNHFDEKTFSFNLTPSKIIQYAITIFGIFLLVNGIFNFFTELNYYIASSKLQAENSDNIVAQKVYYMIEFFRVIVGYLFVFNSQYIASFIESKQDKETVE